MDFAFYNPTRLIFGIGTLSRLGERQASFFLEFHSLLV